MANDSKSQNLSKRKIVSRDEALSLGLQRYFTGAPCRRGHVSERSTKWGACLKCQSIKHKAWLQENPEKVKEHARRYYHKDVKSSRSKQRGRRIKNPDAFRGYYETEYKKNRRKYLQRAKNRYDENPVRSHAYSRQWNQQNPDKRKKIAREWARRNPETTASNAHLRRARILAAGGQFTKSDIDRIFNAQGGRCAYCRVSIACRYHIDHIKPIAKGGSNFPSNIQLCCEECNRGKSDRDPIEFARSRGLLL